MLSEVGIAFSFKGGDQAMRQMQGLGSGWKGLSSAVDSHAPGMMRHFDKMGQSVHNMSQRINSGMRLAKIAITGFLAGKALTGMAEWVKGNSEAQQWTDYLRYMKHSEGAIKEYEAHAKSLRKVLPGIEHADVSKGIFDIASKFGTGMEAVEANKSGLEAAIQLQKGLGPGTQIAEATNLIRKFLWSYGLGKSNEELLPMVQKFAAQIPTAISQTGAQGQDLKVSLGHLVGIYSQLGKPQETLIADMATLAGALGERTGELLRAVMSKTGEGFGKVAYALRKEQFLAKVEARDEYDLPKEIREKLKKSEAITRTRAARDAVKLMDKDPAAYFKMLGGMFDELKRLAEKRGVDITHIITEAFGEGGMQGIPILTKAIQSGMHPELEKALREISPAVAWQELLDSQVSFDARYTIFKQKAEDLGKSIMKPFQAGLMYLMKPWGEKIDEIDKKWMKHEALMESSARQFADSFSGSFRSAFAGAPGLTDMLDRLYKALKDTDPKALNKLGQELGGIAGTSLAGLTTSLTEMNAALADMLPGLRDIAAAVRTAHEAYSSWFGTVDQYNQRRMKEGGVHPLQLGPGDIPIEDAFPGWTGPRAPGPGQAAKPTGEMVSPPAQQGWLAVLERMLRHPVLLGESGDLPEIKQNIEAKIFLDSRELQDAFAEWTVRENARARRGAGDNALGFAVP